MAGKIKISSDKNLIEIDTVHSFLTNAYWSKGIEKGKVIASINNSLCFGIYFDGRQIGFARVITDYVKLAYLLDVFILEDYRGNGYSKLLLNYIFAFPPLKGVKKWMLSTSDAHSLYEKYGFKILSDSSKLMEWIPEA